MGKRRGIIETGNETQNNKRTKDCIAAPESSRLEKNREEEEEKESGVSDESDDGDGSDCSDGGLLRFRYEMLDTDLQKEIMVVMALERMKEELVVDKARLIGLVNKRTNDQHKETDIVLEIDNLVYEGEITNDGSGAYLICED